MSRLIISIIGCQLVGVISTPFTMEAIPIWYASLNKAFFFPPNWIFAPAWILLYTVMGISFFIIWNLEKTGKQNQLAMIAFFTQLFLNFLWSLLFFGLKSPLLGLIEILLLLVVILVTIKFFLPLSKLAAYLLIPYLLWVGFATILNVSIVLLN